MLDTTVPSLSGMDDRTLLRVCGIARTVINPDELFLIKLGITRSDASGIAALKRNAKISLDNITIHSSTARTNAIPRSHDYFEKRPYRDTMQQYKDRALRRNTITAARNVSNQFLASHYEDSENDLDENERENDASSTRKTMRKALPGYLAYLEGCLGDNGMAFTHKLGELVRYAHAAMKHQAWHDAITSDLFYAATCMVREDTEFRTPKDHEGMLMLMSYADSQYTQPQSAQERFLTLLQIKEDIDGVKMSEHYWRTTIEKPKE